MSKPLLTMKVEILEFEAVANFIFGVQLEELTSEELKALYFVLEGKKHQVEKEMDVRKKADQDGNLGQRINKLI